MEACVLILHLCRDEKSIQRQGRVMMAVRGMCEKEKERYYYTFVYNIRAEHMYYPSRLSRACSCRMLIHLNRTTYNHPCHIAMYNLQPFTLNLPAP
jgi:anaerobic ribonucleoside-triphosphate reductase